MSQTKLYFQIEKNSNEVTKNILSKDDLNLCKFNNKTFKNHHR